ncbi:MAG TPA: amidohydrolase family protein [Ohtaekwangia sp.]|uniref:amidohydrolase family protein n=1 Tax=Ohtaekwangia sp. TaxID=2066019 RepID=UPI002F920683
MKNRYSWGRMYLLVSLLFVSVMLYAQEERDLKPVSRTYALTNVNIVQAPGRKVDMATLIIKDGLIKAVGKNISIPPEAIIIKADSLYVYAGFIDGLSRTGVIKPKEENKERPKDPGNPPAERAGITPQLDVRNFLSASDKSVEDLRSLGFTTAHVVPYGGMLPGNGAIIQLTGKAPDDMVLIEESSFYSELTPAERVYPATTMAVIAKWRELYRQAALEKNYATLYASNRSGLERPSSSRLLEPFYPVIDKRTPVLFKAEKIWDIHRVLGLQKDLGFSLILAGVKEGWEVTGKLKSSGARIFLSLDLPEEQKEDKKDEKKDDKKEDKKDVPKMMTDAEKEALEKRKAESIANYVSQAVAFQKAGIPFGFSTLDAKLKDIQANLRRIIKAGLTEDQALAALTTTPAQLLGLSDRLGSVDAGKIANLVVSSKPYFNEKSKVKYVFVEGTLYKIESSDAKKDASIVLEGEWSVTADTPQGKRESVVTIRKEGDKYSGKISGARFPQAQDLEEVTLDGNKLKYTFTITEGGNTMKITVEATVEGTTFKGTAAAGQFGNIPVEGKKKPQLKP